MSANIYIEYEDGYDNNGITTTLKHVGRVTHNCASRAIQNAEEWYAEELNEYHEQGHYAEIVLVDNDES